MDETELKKEIQWLNDPNGGNVKQSILADDFFIKQPQYSELNRTFRNSKYYENGWKWHQLVRILLEPQENSQYMYDRLLSLLLKHRRSHDDYFTLKTEDGVFQIPNTLADLNKLEMLYQKYFQIYLNIKNHIHFDYPKNEHVGPIIRGKINWEKTTKNSSTEFPMTFVTSVQHKEFETPGNILLVLCAEWMFREANRLLQIEFEDPLSDYKKNLLRTIVEKTKIILYDFPFHSVLNSSKRFWNLSYDDPRIKLLESKARHRIRQGLVRNPNYSKLLAWIEEFRELNIPNVSSKTPTKHILDSIENLDTVYEAWIFLEIVEYLHEKGLLINFQLGDNPKCEFGYNRMNVTIWYEKTFSTRGEYAWAVEHRPDFTAMLDNEILAVFDAKNYGKSSSITDTQNKMLAYITNLDANFGALIYPNHPKFWDDLNKEQKIEKLKSVLAAKFPQESDYNIKKMAKTEANLAWEELSKEHQDIMPPKAYKKLEYPGQDKRARYHFDLTLCLMRMSPQKTDFAVNMKNETLDAIFKAIVERIPITVKT